MAQSAKHLAGQIDMEECTLSKITHPSANQILLSEHTTELHHK